MKISKLHQYDVITLVPIYREEEHDLTNTITSFTHDSKTLKFFVVMIIDGCPETADVLHRILNIDSKLVYERAENHKYLFHQNEQYNFLIIVKDENKGKFDSQLLFLSILNNSVDDRSFVFNKLKLSVLMLDSDTEFTPNSVNILHNTLWHQKDTKVAAVTGIVYARARLFNILECAQYYEYLISHIVRKNFESTMKSVICLQGNYSLFKLSVLLDEDVRRNFSTPQKSILGLHDSLGEDRFLSGIILKKGYKTLYTPQSTALTTVPATLISYLLQRKRWNNSILSSYLSFFCENKKYVSWHIKPYLGLDLLTKFLMPAILYQFYSQFAFVSESEFLSHQFEILDISYFITALLLLVVLSCKCDVRHYPRLWNFLCILITFAYSMLIFQVWNNLVGVIQGHFYFFEDQKILLLIGASLSLCIMIRSNFRIKNFYYWLCHIVTLPITSVVSTIYAFSQFDNFVWGTRNLNIDHRHFIAHQSKFFLLKLRLLSGYIFLNTLYLLIGVYFSVTLLNWLLVGYLIIEFVPIFFLPTLINFWAKINFKKKVTSLTFEFRKILKKMNF